MEGHTSFIESIPAQIATRRHARFDRMGNLVWVCVVVVKELEIINSFNYYCYYSSCVVVRHIVRGEVGVPKLQGT